MTSVAVGIGYSVTIKTYVKSNFCCQFDVFSTGKASTDLPHTQISDRESNCIYTVCRQNNDAANTVPMHGFQPDRT